MSGRLDAGDELILLAETVGRLLAEAGATLATAESCSGGLLAHTITNVPGSSAYFMRGWVTYSNDAKCADLAVPAALLAAHGAVSAEVAEAMARGAALRAHTTYALSTTGVAGPGGGSAAKPVGLVYIAVAGAAERVDVYRNIFAGDRLAVKEQTVRAALAALHRRLLCRN